jgi:hypothetical protein
LREHNLRGSVQAVVLFLNLPHQALQFAVLGRTRIVFIHHRIQKSIDLLVLLFRLL